MPKLLSLVICMAALTWLTILAASLIRSRAWTPKGMMTAFGNRDNLPEATPFAARTERTARNTFDNFVLFAVVALVAQAAGVANANVTHGAEVFLWARLVYVPVYWIGVPYLLTVVWASSIVGLAIMLVHMCQ